MTVPRSDGTTFDGNMFRSMAEEQGLVDAQGDATWTWYQNCDQARMAGAAPMQRGTPGYRPALDADDDGVACEPYY